MPRSTDIWHSDNHDAAIPAKVKLRVFEKYKRTCFLCGQPIRTSDSVDFDHWTPLADGGEHSEENLVPVHRKCHRLKTAREAQARAETRASVKHHYGIKSGKTKWASRPLGRGNHQHTATRAVERWTPEQEIDG